VQLIFSCVGLENFKKALVQEAKIKKLQSKDLIYYLWFIGVDPDKQNKGIGSPLIKEVIE